MSAATPLLAALGLTRSPFPPTPDAGSYFFTPHLQEQFAEVMHCVEARKGFVLLTGEVALGKSTLVRRLLDTLPAEKTCSALVFNTFLQGPALLAAVLRDFGLPPSGSIDVDLAALNAFLLDRHREEKTCLLVIDDAQNLSIESLELVRLLCNLETGQEKLLQILLVGQPELETVLNGIQLRQLKSRIFKHARLHGLLPAEVARYFEFRITAAGGAGRISLAPAAARLLYRSTGGNLRQIHWVLDRCLYGLAAKGQGMIDKPLLAAAVKEVASQSGSSHRLRWAWIVGGGAFAALAMVSVVQWQILSSVPSPPASTLVSAPAIQPAAPFPAPSVAAPPMVAASTALPATGSGGECVERLLQQAKGGRAVVSQSLPVVLASKVQALPGVCLHARGQQFWATWQPHPLTSELGSPQASHLTRFLQEKLSQRGLLEPALVDGMNGPRTRMALQSFQQGLGLPSTGNPDELTVMLLEKLHAI